MNELNFALEHFKKILEEQMLRIASTDTTKTDFTTKKQVIIGVIDGDGIGPIITEHAYNVLKYLLADEIASGAIVLKQINGLTIENRIACNQPIPSDVLAEIKTCDVLLKGPTTTPHGGTMESANVAMRRELDLYANCRPVCIPEQNIQYWEARVWICPVWQLTLRSPQTWVPAELPGLPLSTQRTMAKTMFPS